MKKKINYVPSDELFYFGEWLLEENFRGYALLVLHGSQLGLRMSKQLKLTWGDFIDKDKKVKPHLKMKGKQDRPINNLIAEITLKAYTSGDRLDSPIYTTSLNQAIETYNLRRDLSRHYHNYSLAKGYPVVYDSKFFSPQILEIAWIRDFLLDQNLHPDAFKFISRHLKHNNIGYTIDMVGLNPKEPNTPELRYDYVEKRKNNYEMLESKKSLFEPIKKTLEK